MFDFSKLGYCRFLQITIRKIPDREDLIIYKRKKFQLN